ncbi:MAG: hypothetical protein ACK4HN_11520 [Thermosynechococcus sp.]|uniref:hypothetical protein n=1 Tax=Thermosynechococcus sp. TaxID=2814275 RepID=UPI00391D0140
MGLIEDLEKAIGASRRNYGELLAIAGNLLMEKAQTLENAAPPPIVLTAQPWTEARLKKTFGGFRAAQAYFRERYGVRANSWQVLADRANAVETALVHLGLAIRPNSKTATLTLSSR